MKVLIVGDSPFISTGFGRVTAHAAAAFAKAGYDVGVVSGLSNSPVKDTLGYKIYYPETGDVLGVKRTIEAIEDFDPDLIYHTGEPGTLTAFAKVTPVRIPFLAYTPIEGEPIINSNWINILKAVNVMTCSEYGANVVERDVGKKIEWAYHGVDTDTFKPNPARREEVRKILGWDGKFIIITVATNVRRKQHPRLFEAIKILKERYKQVDIILYDHTIPFDDHWLEGWNLPELAKSMGIREQVGFNPALLDLDSSIPEVGEGEKLGLVDLLVASDLFVLCSQVEGFGLPIAEAMACGVPVLVTKYAAGWEVARPAGYGIPVKDWETHKSGVRYANVDPEAMAKTILDIKRNPRESKRRSELGLQRVRDFRWEDFTEKLIALAETAIQEKAKANALSSEPEEFEDSSEDEGQRPGDTADTRDATEAEKSLQEA
jgi:glycosyltransferase involved in cell wall biosynthesis